MEITTGNSADGREHDAHPVNYAPVKRADGVTESERYLQRLCERSFLRLWSYPGVYRDQGGGKEVADLLVIFGDDIIIFSDKLCVFPSSGDLSKDWSRWYEKAVRQSARQAWGAERWILDHPARLFLDRQCKVAFPIQIPRRETARIHRIVVAHGVSERCRSTLGGSGSLMFCPKIGDVQTTPFTIGDLDPARGFVHVLDDRSLEVLLETLDTVADFVAYLRAKEAEVRSGRLAMSAGEEEILALYLTHGDATGHKFPNVEDGAFMIIEEGHWDAFVASSRRRAQLDANAVSYAWDNLIKEFEQHFLAGTSVFRSHENVRDLEPILRHMAAENRTKRRYLAEQLIEVIRMPIAATRPFNARVAATEDGGSAYVFVSMNRSPSDTDTEYRDKRRMLVESYVLVTAYLLRQFKTVVGIATEPSTAGARRSEDAYLLHVDAWDPTLEEQARQLHEEVGLFSVTRSSSKRVVEYPAGDGRPESSLPALGGRARNLPCPCGSGAKYKRCCGR